MTRFDTHLPSQTQVAAESGFPVVGIDVDPSKVDAINQRRASNHGVLVRR